MLFALFYIVAISILVLHFTGFLARHNLEWLVFTVDRGGSSCVFGRSVGGRADGRFC